MAIRADPRGVDPIEPDSVRDDSARESRLLLAVLTKLAGGVDKSDLPINEWHVYQRFQAKQDLGKLWGLLQSCPKHVYVDVSGRQTRTLHQQADLYGLPLRGRTVDITKVVRAFHDFLAKNHHKLAAISEDATPAENSAALERLRTEQWRRERMRRRADEGDLLPREGMLGAFQQYAGKIRDAADELERRFGPDAHEIMMAHITAGEAAVESFFDAGKHNGNGKAD